MSSKARIYLYKEGNECESITGGWNIVKTNAAAHVVGVLDKKENYMSVISSSVNNISNVYTRNKINLVNQVVYGEIYDNNKPLFSYKTHLLTNTDYNSNEFTNKVSYENITDLQIKNVPITDNSYVMFHAPATSFKIKNVWVELGQNVISINSQDTSSINFSCNTCDNLISITKAEVYINNQLSKTCNDNFDNITYDIDKNLCSAGANNIKIKVTYSQGDDIYETVEEVLTHTNAVNNLSTSSSLKELIDRQELLTNSIEVQKNTLKSILESKNVEVLEEENKLSILINKVNEFDDYAPPILYLYNEGDKCVDITNGWALDKKATSSYGSIVLTNNSNNMNLEAPSGNNSGTTSNGYVVTSSLIDGYMYSKVKLDVEVKINGTQAYNRFGFEIIDSSGNVIANNLYKSYTSSRNIEELVIPRTVSEFKVRIYVNADPTASNPRHFARIYKIWLER